MAGGPGKRNETVRRVLLKVNNARKFVLDQTMSEFLAVLSNNFWSGGSLRKRNRMLKMRARWRACLTVFRGSNSVTPLLTLQN